MPVSNSAQSRIGGGPVKRRRLLASGVVVGLILVGVLLAIESTRAIGIVVSVIPLLLLALFANPVLFVLLYVGMRPLVDSVVFLRAGGYTFGVVWGALLMVVLAIYWFTRGIRRPIHGASWLVPTGFVLAYALFTLTRGGDALAVLSNCIKLASWVLVALTCEQIASTAKGQRLIVRAGTLMAVLTVAVIVFAVVKNQYGAAYYAGDNSYDTAAQGPHGLASLAVLTSVFVWMGAMRDRRRGVYVALAGLLGVAVALSFVRTTFLAFALITVWFLLWSLRSRRPSAVIAAFAATLAVFAAVYAFQDAMLGRLSDLSSLASGGGVEFSTGSGRIGLWQAVWQSATASPEALLLGQGAGASGRAAAAVTGTVFWAHNDFLEFLITGGIGLLVLHILTLGWLLTSGVRLSRDQHQSKAVREVGRLISVAGLAYLVMAFFNGMAFYLSASLAMAMIVGLARGMQETPGATFLDAPAIEGHALPNGHEES